MRSSEDDGVVKYSSERRDGVVSDTINLSELIRARTTLFDLGLIGAYPDGIGYGNLSLRTAGNQFAITGSATGSQRELTRTQFCLVESFSLDDNRVQSLGILHASSEAMTHGAIYASQCAAHCVMHIHSRILFDALLRQGQPATPADISYGTPAMAHSLARLASERSQLPALFVMAGHDEGIVAFGTDVASTLELLVETFERTHAS